LTKQIEALTPELEASDPSVKSFYAGICLGVDRRLFARKWKKASPDSWALVDGTQPGTLALLIKGLSPDNGDDRRWRIVVDPTVADGRFTVESERGQIVYVADIPGLIWEFDLKKEAGFVLVEEEEEEAPQPGVTQSEVLEPTMQIDLDLSPMQYGLHGWSDDADLPRLSWRED
jgi:hypothetical protein